jgi:hypothetical protein
LRNITDRYSLVPNHPTHSTVKIDLIIPKRSKIPIKKEEVSLRGGGSSDLSLEIPERRLKLHSSEIPVISLEHLPLSNWQDFEEEKNLKKYARAAFVATLPLFSNHPTKSCKF